MTAESPSLRCYKQEVDASRVRSPDRTGSVRSHREEGYPQFSMCQQDVRSGWDARDIRLKHVHYVFVENEGL